MSLIFWLSFAVIAYTYVGYPAIMFLLARFASHPWRKAPFNAPVSIVMAVHNGAARLAEQIEHLTSLDPERVREVIIVSDGSTDGTR